MAVVVLDGRRSSHGARRALPSSVLAWFGHERSARFTAEPCRATWVRASRSTRHATDPALAAITAITSLALAIGGPTAVALIERSVDDVLETPSAFGADWDMQLLQQPDDPEALVASVLAEDSVEAFALQVQAPGNQWTIVGPSGTALAAPIAFDALVGSMGPILDAGRLPETAWGRRDGCRDRRPRRSNRSATR